MHLSMELFKQMTGTQMVHVPSNGDGPAVLALLAGGIQLYAGGPLVLAQHIANGKIRALARSRMDECREGGKYPSRMS